MKNLLKAFLESKKAAATLVAVIVWVAGRVGWGVDPVTLGVAVGAIMAFVLAQGWADNGKEAEKLKAAKTDAMDEKGEPKPGFMD